MPQDPQDPQTTSVESMLKAPAKLAGALERAAAAGMFAAAGIAPELPPAHTLEDALRAAREDLVLEAIDGDSCHELAAQAYAVEVLERLVAHDRIGAADPGPENPGADAIVEAALELAIAVNAAGLTDEHFHGIFNPLLRPLEDLGAALEAAGHDLSA